LNSIRSKVQVNIPCQMLMETHLQRFVEEGLNPEIGLDAGALDRYRATRFKRVAGVLKGAGLAITLHAPFMDLAPGSPDPLVRGVAVRRFEQVLAIAAILEPRTVVCHSGYGARRHRYLKDVWWKNSVEVFAGVASRLSQVGARLMIENVYEDEPGELSPLFDELGEECIGFCLDVGHQAAFGHAPLSEWLDVLGDRIGQIHLHDNRGEWDDHLALGTGGIDFEWFFGRLRGILRHPPVITMEPHREEDLYPSMAFLGRVWPW
jgi:sugar phosphate isomerase/epimerase